MAPIRLRCEVSPGMFSDERIVVIRKRGGGTAAFVVPSKDVEIDSNGQERGAGILTASLVQRDDTKWAVLPTEYQDTIPIDDSVIAK